MTVARTFPSTEQRKNCKAWNASEELSEAMSNADAVLSSIASHSKTAWQASWPLEEDEENVDKAFSKWRDSVLDHWGQKVNEAQGVIPKGGFKTFDTTISAQMKSSIASGKPLERTRRVKQKVALVGGLELDAGSHDMQFDDGELYRTLLREIIESGEGVGGGLRYAQLSKGGRVKKKRDRALSKGKRLKYEVHEKLIGFLAPTPLPDPGPLNEILASLFGKMGTVKNDVE